MTALTISPPRPYVKFVEEDRTLTVQGYDLLFGLYKRVGGSLSDLNAATLLDKTWDSPDPIGSIAPSTGRFTNLTAVTSFTASGFTLTTTAIAINPTSGLMDRVAIGNSTPAPGKFSDLQVVPTTGTNVRLEPSSTLTITGGSGVSIMNNVSIGATTASTGKFTSLQATGNFGCNGSAVQPSYAIGATLNAYASGANGLSSGADMQALVNKVLAIEATLKANGICTT